MEEDESYQTKRFNKLGFFPQKEIVYNQLLPYADKIDAEALNLLKDIKTNLVKSVLARELRPGFALWSARLVQYIKLYGCMFSKEDHIHFIKLFYEVMIIENQEPTRVTRCVTMLSTLLKKRYLISREDIQLEWKPLYKLFKKVSQNTEADRYRFPACMDHAISNIIRMCRIYFPASATQEILDEFRKDMCPFDAGEMSVAVDYLEIFLPIAVKPEEGPLSYNLWLDEFMKTWNACLDDNNWEGSMMWLIARLAALNIGHIDWEPYIHTMYARFTRSLQLPVNYKLRVSSKTHRIDVGAMALWIVSSLNTKTETSFYHLEKFMKMIKSYFYSANAGRWTMKLREFLNKVSYHFVNRIYCERYRKKTWETDIPEHFKLSDEDIDRFVNTLKPCVEHGMFCRLPTGDIAATFQNLACLRPHLIVPLALEKLYASLDSLTEPHKLISAMSAVIAVGRYMVQGAKYDYPEGPTHVIPLLMSVLPGIDLNDLRKSFMTFYFLKQFLCMIPIINSADASNYYKDLTEEEHIICEASAGFEDFVLEFVDRICVWVESSSLDFIRPEQQTRELSNRGGIEYIAENAVTSVITIILRQCSPEIFRTALKKTFNFATSKILEIDVAGRLLAKFCGCFSKVYPKDSLKLFIPHFCDRIESLLRENSAAQKDEHLDEELLYNLLILSEVIDGRTEVLLYMDRLFPILDQTIHMTSIAANKIGSHMLSMLMLSLTIMQPIECRSSDISYDTHVKEFLPIKEWGLTIRARDLKLKWYVPGEKEITIVEQLVEKYLVPELNKLDKYSAGELVLDRTELRRSLKIITAVTSGYAVFPMWKESSIQLIKSVAQGNSSYINEGILHAVNMPDGRNIRKVLADAMHRVQARILKYDEGDTKSVSAIVNIYNTLIFNKSKLFDFETSWKAFAELKKMLTNRLLERKHHLRHLLIDRVTLLQLFRSESTIHLFSETHKQILFDIFELATSNYSEVRIYAQLKLSPFINSFPYTYTLLIPKLKEILKSNPEENHERFKACLYILTNSKSYPLITKHDWNFIKEIWPLVVNSTSSEKPSIVNLITAVSEAVSNNFPTIAIDLEIPQSILTTALKLSETAPACDRENFDELTSNSEDKLKETCSIRRKDYNATVEALLEACLNPNLHWRYRLLAIGFIRDIAHPDVKFGPEVVNYFLKALINDSISIRKIAMKVMVYILLQNKSKYKKITIDPFKFSKSNRETLVIAPGLREDNKWLLYNSKTVPRDSKSWEETRYVNSNSLGYYTWPKELKVYAPPSEQPSIVDDLEKMSAEQKVIYEFFTNEDNVSQLIKFLSLEEKKGKDIFGVTKAFIFKYLFKTFESKLLPIFLPHLEKLAVEKQESSQRCAAEIIAGLIRGSKHWKYEQVESMWHEIIPILHGANQNILTETINDWTFCVCLILQDRDPNRHHWILEFLMDDPLADPTSFIASARLHLVNNALGQQSWRNSELYTRLLDYLKKHLNHPFQNIRNKIGMSLKMIFNKDLAMPEPYTPTDCPKLKDFFDECMPKFNELYKDSLAVLDKNFVVADDMAKVPLDNDSEKDNGLRLFKIVGKFTSSMLICKTNMSTSIEFYKLLPLSCLLENNDVDEELKPICANLIALLGQALAVEQNLSQIFQIIEETAKCPFWSARCNLAEFLSAFVFYNMAVLLTKPELVARVQTIVLNLLEDAQPEVRTKAGQVLNGLLHCDFLPSPMELLGQFKLKAKTKLKKSEKNTKDRLKIRHAGVLGMCAFISANPYDVPEYLPDVFGQLGPHLNDPQPIPTTIKTTLGDFKRTHQDNWEEHKLKFTEEELEVLRDLTVPPSYYA